MIDTQWQQINNQEDIDHIMTRFGGFHDSCIKELYIWTGHHVDEDLSMSVPMQRDYKVRLLVQRQYANPTAIELMFDELVQLYIKPSPENYDSIIYGANFLCKDGLFYWADDREWTPEKAHQYQDVNWICSNKMKWREVNEWVGEIQRYGPQDNIE
ncbi:hypothetical protein [Paenibacillus shenyangensis]|uniref:hypothetical protein n=1 Tax=Paenibacillus sp. A9 TaxID=1284352 RepID=UPI00036A9AA2|nr:hypothetical protein [Paenibacillus sp. A9]